MKHKKSDLDVYLLSDYHIGGRAEWTPKEKAKMLTVGGYFTIARPEPRFKRHVRRWLLPVLLIATALALGVLKLLHAGDTTWWN